MNTASAQADDAGTRRFSEARKTLKAGQPQMPVSGSLISSAGFLLYCYVYEARWAGLRTAEICPRWSELPNYCQDGWEDLARELASFVSQPANNVTEPTSIHVTMVPWCQCCECRVPIDHICACEADISL